MSLCPLFPLCRKARTHYRQILQIVSAQASTPGFKQTAEGKESHCVSLHQLKSCKDKENSLGCQARHLYSVCSLGEGKLTRKKKKVKMCTLLLHFFMQSWSRQPTSFLLLWFFHDFTDGNKSCGLHVGKDLEHNSKENIIGDERTGTTLLSWERLTHWA